jgi:hypothetical protein
MVTPDAINLVQALLLQRFDLAQKALARNRVIVFRDGCT